MTTSRSSLAFLLVLAGPAAAQEVTLPSGLAATLFDVVLEDGTGAPLAPDAGTDPDAGPDAAEEAAALGDEPLDQDAGGGSAGGGIARFHLLVPGLGGKGAGFQRVAGDLRWACEALALPALAANGWAAAEVVIALADREVPFGATDPEAVQFFEGFRVEGGACVPQAF